VLFINIISSLDDYKIRKTRFMESEFNKYIKYCDYAEEQCIIQEKLLLSISQMYKYCDEINNIVETIIIEPIQKHICLINIVETIFIEPIQKHICLISTDTIIVYPSFTFKLSVTNIKNVSQIINEIHKNKKYIS
jgi:hypothetical protein